MDKQWQRAAQGMMLSILLAASSAAVHASAGSGEAGATASILVNATPKVVWQAVHKERFEDPDIAYTRIRDHNGDSSTLEEKFVSVPILGSVTAVLKQHEEPYRSIDYSLIRSDKFKRMEGRWSLTPVNGGKQTMLKLSSFLDVGVPFSAHFIRGATQRKIDRRIANVKRMAEQQQAQLAASGKDDLE